MDEELKIKVLRALADGVRKGLITQEQADDMYNNDPDIIKELKKAGQEVIHLPDVDN